MVMELITLGAAATQWFLGNAANHQGKIAAARENITSAQNQANEYRRQKDRRQDTFNADVTTQYGSDFLSKLNSVASVTDLIGSIGRETALGKQLAEYETLARQAVENAQTENAQTGTLANMQGQSNALTAHQQNISGAMSEGQAAAQQASSGIRTTGTGDNLRKMQELQNDISSRLMALGMEQNNVQAIFGMNNTQLSASQQAEAQRRQSMITERQAVESALSAYRGHQDEIADLDESIKNSEADAKYWTDEEDDMDSPVGWLAGLFGFRL